MKKALIITAACVAAVAAIGAVAAIINKPIKEGTRPQPVKTTKQPFVSGVTGESENIRIPSMVVLNSGRIVCAADARYDEGQDGGGLDTIIAYSDDGGENWTSYTANYLGDNGNVFSHKSSAFIDPEMVTDGENIWMITSFYSGGRNLVERAKMKAGTAGNAFDSEGFLRLSGNHGKSYDYKVDIISFDGGFSDILDANDKPTGYRIDEYYYLFNKNNKRIGNIFYLAEKTKYSVLPTTYIYMTKSEDGGESFGKPKLINLKAENESFLGAGPGRGLFAQDGIIYLSAYTFNLSDGGQNACFIYSEDDGISWKRAPSIESNADFGFSGESQLVELPDGTLRCVFRNGANRICYADCIKKEDGYEWLSPVVTEIENTSNCMISAIAVNRNEKNYILISCPTGINEDGNHDRSAGKIFTFEFTDDNDMKLINEYKVNDSFFAYSCLAGYDEKTALLYEDEGCHITIEMIENLIP